MKEWISIEKFLEDATLSLTKLRYLTKKKEF